MVKPMKPMTFKTFIIGVCIGLSPANAETVGAEMASRLLARSQAVDSKCQFLDARQREELAAFVSRAEVALVSKTSVETSKSTFAAGKAEGREAACSDAEKTEMLSILDAASQASAAVQPATAVKPTMAPAHLAVSATEPKLLPPIAKGKSALNQYAAIATKYYFARRCNTMSYSSINSFYQTVVSTHHSVVYNLVCLQLGP